MCRVQDFLRSKPAINDSCAFTGHNASASALLFKAVFFAVGWVLAWDVNAEAQVPSAKDLIDGNAAAIAQVRLIDMTFQRLASHDPTDPSATDDVFSTCRWTADMLADVERFRFHTPRPIHPDYPPNRQGKFEVERRGTTFRCLFTSDWEKREQLTPFRQRGVQAFVDPTYGQQDQRPAVADVSTGEASAEPSVSDPTRTPYETRCFDIRLEGPLRCGLPAGRV